jgi:hypothetical protein
MQLRSVSIQTLRENLSIIPQDPTVLFAGSIEDAFSMASTKSFLGRSLTVCAWGPLSNLNVCFTTMFINKLVKTAIQQRARSTQ